MQKLLTTITTLYAEVCGPADWPEAVRWAFTAGIITSAEHSALLAGIPLP